MIQFRPVLQQRVTDILTAAVGRGSDPKEWVKTFDTRLRDVEIEQLPYLVVTARTTEKLLPPEIGNRFQKYTWTVHIYYLDMEVNVDNWDIADARRDHIMGRIEKALEQHSFLDLNNSGPLKSQDTDGHCETVYDSSIQMISWDSSGQDGHQSFVSELYFEVYTDRY